MYIHGIKEIMDPTKLAIPTTVPVLLGETIPIIEGAAVRRSAGAKNHRYILSQKEYEYH